MDLLAILTILRAAGEVTAEAADLIAKLHQEQREATAEEITAAKARQAAAEAAWQATLPKAENP